MEKNGKAHPSREYGASVVEGLVRCPGGLRGVAGSSPGFDSGSLDEPEVARPGPVYFVAREGVVSDADLNDLSSLRNLAIVDEVRRSSGDKFSSARASSPVGPDRLRL